MTAWQKIILAIALSLFSVALQAQAGDDELQAQVRAAGAELRASEERTQHMSDAESRMREAEQRLAEAAQQIAELSAQQLPRVAQIERRIRIDGRPLLGVTIGSDRSREPVEGVRIEGVSPGGAAAEAGLRSGDIITAINGESFTGGNAAEANAKLLDFMAGVETGDELEVDYLREGKSNTVAVTPRDRSTFAFAFGNGDFDFGGPSMAVVPGHRYGFAWSTSGFGNLEMVSLTKGLGRYFGTDKGLLIVRAPEDNDFNLQDGDVIQSIDGRDPTSVKHAMRILGSYEGGEKLDIVIMRDKRKKTITVEMPDHRSSHNWRFAAPKVSSKVVPLRPRPVREIEERT